MARKSTVKDTKRRTRIRPDIREESGNVHSATVKGGFAAEAKKIVAERVSVDNAGRVVVPAKIRKTLGIEGGQELSVSLAGDVIKIQTLQTAVRNAQALARRKRTAKGSVVDEFLAQRRVEAKKD